MENNKAIKIVVVSGGFDPIHIGHVRMILEAKKLGDRLVVVINNDNWLRKKKGFAFMPQEERKEIVEAIQGVDEVVLTTHEEGTGDMSVIESLKIIQPHIFANGGDRKNVADVLEAAICNEIGCEMVFNIGFGGKVQSSSWLIAKSKDESPCSCKSGKKFKECHGK